MIERVAVALLLLFVPGSPLLASGQAPKRFNPKSYPANSFHVSRHDYALGELTIRVIHAKKIYDRSSSTLPSYCRAWLEVRKDGEFQRQAYFGDIDPVGSDFGIWLPKRQPLEDLFLALKSGDYDARLLLAGKDGSLSNLPGGPFFLTPDKQYLIGYHGSDYTSPFVIDAVRRQIVIDGAKLKLPAVGDWYQDRVGYFYTEDAYEDQLQPKDPVHVNIFRLNLKIMKITKESISQAKLKSAQIVNYEPWEKTSDCTSEK